MTITSSPPIRTSPDMMAVSSGLNVRLASLNGSEIRTTSCTPSSTSMRPVSGCPCPTAPSTVLVTPVERCTSIPISINRATTCSIWASLARSSITTTMASVASPSGTFMITVHRLSALLSVVLRVRARRLETVFVVNDPPLQPARLVDDAFEQPPDGFGPQGPFGGNATHVFEHQLLAVRLVHLEALQLFQSADFAHASCALVQKAHQHFVDSVDVVAQIVKRGHGQLIFFPMMKGFRPKTLCSLRDLSVERDLFTKPKTRHDAPGGEPHPTRWPQALPTRVESRAPLPLAQWRGPSHLSANGRTLRHAR